MSISAGIPGLFDFGVEGDAAGKFSLEKRMKIYQ